MLKKVAKILRQKLRSKKGVSFGSVNFYLHKSSYIEVCDSSKLNFHGKCSVNKYVTIFLNENSEINIEDDVYIGDYSTIRATRTKVFIGRNTIIGQDVKLLATNHAYNRMDILIKEQDIDVQKIGIRIGYDCWLGAGCVVLPGVSLGNGVVVGANAVVTKDVPDYAVVVGNPAKIIKYRT